MSDIRSPDEFRSIISFSHNPYLFETPDQSPCHSDINEDEHLPLTKEDWIDIEN